jgi:hypothetical protein
LIVSLPLTGEQAAQLVSRLTALDVLKAVKERHS